MQTDSGVHHKRQRERQRNEMLVVRGSAEFHAGKKGRKACKSGASQSLEALSKNEPHSAVVPELSSLLARAVCASGLLFSKQQPGAVSTLVELGSIPATTLLALGLNVIQRPQLRPCLCSWKLSGHWAPGRQRGGGEAIEAPSRSSRASVEGLW